jgi:hypothetical protein
LTDSIQTVDTARRKRKRLLKVVRMGNSGNWISLAAGIRADRESPYVGGKANVTGVGNCKERNPAEISVLCPSQNRENYQVGKSRYRAVPGC